MQSLKENRILIKFLKPYTTHLCQPLDLSINYILKSRMKEQWIDWFKNNPGISPSKQAIYIWFKKAFDSLTPLNIIKAFLLSGISNDVNGIEDLLSPNLLLLRNKSVKPSQICEPQEEEMYYQDAYGAEEHQYFNDMEIEGEYIFEESYLQK